MIPNYKQSCNKFNLDFTKQYPLFSKKLGDHCRFCHTLLSYEFQFAQCHKCKYYICFNNHYLSQVIYKKYVVIKNNNKLYARHLLIRQDAKIIHDSTIIDLQTLLNRINTFK